jgi:hypothetical protein
MSMKMGHEEAKLGEEKEEADSDIMNSEVLLKMN